MATALARLTAFPSPRLMLSESQTAAPVLSARAAAIRSRSCVTPALYWPSASVRALIELLLYDAQVIAHGRQHVLRGLDGATGRNLRRLDVSAFLGDGDDLLLSLEPGIEIVGEFLIGGCVGHAAAQLRPSSCAGAGTGRSVTSLPVRSSSSMRAAR